MKPLHALPVALLFAATAFATADGNIGHELRPRNILFQSIGYNSVPTVYPQLLDLGLTSFATRCPDVAQRELTAYYAAKKARQ